jgi:hypothetical protein
MFSSSEGVNNNWCNTVPSEEAKNNRKAKKKKAKNSSNTPVPTPSSLPDFDHYPPFQPVDVTEFYYQFPTRPAPMCAQADAVNLSKISSTESGEE